MSETYRVRIQKESGVECFLTEKELPMMSLTGESDVLEFSSIEKALSSTSYHFRSQAVHGKDPAVKYFILSYSGGKETIAQIHGPAAFLRLRQIPVSGGK